MADFGKYFACRYCPALFLVLSLVSCEAEPYGGDPPLFLINGQKNIMDSIKITQDPFYILEFTIEDDEAWRELRVNNLTEGLLRYKEKIINDILVEITKIKEGRLEFEALRKGRVKFNLEVRDRNDLFSSIDIHFFVFDNLAPVGVLQLIQTDELGPYQVQLNASDSYDMDHRWGGRIMKWEFFIAGFYTTTIDQPVIDYIFPEPGKYSIGLRVLDNDGVWSEKVLKEIEVQ